MQASAFMPVPGLNTAAANVTAASVAIALPSPVGSSAPQVRIYNSSGVIAYIAFGTTAAPPTAVIPVNGAPANGIPIAPGAVEVITPPPQSTQVAVIAGAAGATPIFFTMGEGV